MATRLAWWTIPATVVVLVRVVTLEPKAKVEPHQAPSVVAAAEVAAEPVSAVEHVVLRDATGARTGPVRFAREEALVLQLPKALGRQRVDFTLHRYLLDQDEPSLWLHGTPRPRSDGTLPILGLPAGRYALELVWTENGSRHRVVRPDIRVPGKVDCTR